MWVLVLMTVLWQAVAMLPPETFKDPIFAAVADSDDDDGGHEPTEFA